jgi:hypothetical protein
MERDKGLPRVKVSDSCGLTVDRALVDKAHALGLMPGAFNRLAARTRNPTLCPVRDIDAHFATMIDREFRGRSLRCELAAIPIAVPEIAPAEHGALMQAVLQEAEADKWQGPRRMLAARAGERFAVDVAVSRRALAAAMEARR